MTKKEALEKSIEKWKGILCDGNEDDGNNDCALCTLYWRNGCMGCPVKAKTGESDCRNTPYSDWVHHNKEVHEDQPKKVLCEKCAKLAYQELEFLKSLRDDEKTEKSQMILKEKIDEINRLIKHINIARNFEDNRDERHMAISAYILGSLLWSGIGAKLLDGMTRDTSLPFDIEAIRKYLTEKAKEFIEDKVYFG